MEIRRVVVILGAILIFAEIRNVRSQGGVDFMMDTPLGEMPTPLVASMASAGANTDPNAPNTGGGLHNQALLSMFDPSSGGHLALDPTSIAGFSNGQTINLPSDLRNRFMNGLLNTISVDNAPVAQEPKTQFSFRNEDFTALGNVGHLVRVPNGGIQHADAGHAATTTTDLGALTGAKVTINGNPIEIIGVADMSQLDPSGNPHFFSFNPGTGSAAELQALQSALLGTAVDMSNFVPPPYLADAAAQGGTSNIDPALSSLVMTETTTTVETEHTTNNTQASNQAAAASSVAASSSVDRQLEMLLSQGHSQADTQTDITAIMGQIDSAINDINRRSNISSSGSSDMSTINSGSGTQQTFAYNGIDSAQAADNSLASVFSMNADNSGLVVSDNAFRESGSGRLSDTLSNMQLDSTMHNNVQSGVDTNVDNFSVVSKDVSMRAVAEPHASDVVSSGIYPLEGNMAARYAAIKDISQRLTKLDGRLGGVSTKDILKTDTIGTDNQQTGISLSSTNTKSGGISFTSVPGNSVTDGGTGIFAVSRSLEEMLKSQTGQTSLRSDLGMDTSSVPISLGSFAQSGNTNTNNIDSVPVHDRKVLSNVNRADSIELANTNIDNIGNTQSAIRVGMGSISNLINASSNKLSSNSGLTNNRLSATITDSAASVPLTGSNGGPITNMVGIQGRGQDTSSTSRLSTLENTVLSSLDAASTAFDNSVNSASTSPVRPMTLPGRSMSTSFGSSMLSNAGVDQFSSMSTSMDNNMFSSVDTSAPSGTFVVGAGQPNPTVISTGNRVSSDSGSFSLSSRPGTMGTFSMGSDSSFGSTSGISNRADVGIDTSNLANEMGSDLNHTVIHTVTTVEEITSVESSSSNTSGSASSAASAMGSSSMSTFDSPQRTNQFNSLPDMTGGFDIGNGGGANANVLNTVSLPNARFQGKKNTVFAAQNEMLIDQKATNAGIYTPPIVDQPKTAPLVMGQIKPEASASTMMIKPAVSSPAPANNDRFVPDFSMFSPDHRVSVGTGMTRPRTQAVSSFNSNNTLIQTIEPMSITTVPTMVLSERTQAIDQQIIDKPPETRAAALPSQWSATGSDFSVDGLAVGQHSKPIVGNIFSDAAIEATSRKLTQKFLEQTGITKKPALDFMTSFLNQNDKNTNNQNLQIVPLGSDNTMRRNPTNMFVVGTGARKTDPLVDNFGVADITRRSKQLNNNQWSNFVGSKTQEPDIKYQTQNVIGAAETRPLNGNGQTSITTDFNTKTTLSVSAPSSSSKGSGSSTQTTSAKTKRSKNAGFVFEAPGMSGRTAVSVSSFNPVKRNTAAPSTSIITKRRTVETNVPLANTVGVSDTQMSSSALSDTQTTAIKASEFTNNFKQNLKSSGVPINGPNFMTINKNGNIDSTNTIVTTNQISDSSMMGTASLETQAILEAARNNLALNNQMMNVDTSAQLGLEGPISTTNIERMHFGKPVVLNKVTNTTTITQTSGGMGAQDGSAMMLNQNVDSTIGRRGTLTAVSNTPVINSQSQNSGQTVEATRFTSGNRFAVFGPANDVSGRSFRAKATTRKGTGMRIGVLAPVAECRYQPDPSSRYYFIYKNGVTQHRFRCALGTAFDEMTCECSIRVSDHDDCLEVHMDFNNGVVEDSSLNRLPIGNQNVEITNSSSPLSGIALFGGDGKLTIWRYQNYDFRDHVMLKVQFRPGPGGDRFQSLISNCGRDGPSIAIIYDSKLKEVLLFLKTSNDTQKELQFRINPDEWNDVTYIYDGQEFIGIVNGVRRYVSRQDPHLLGIIGGEIKSVPTQGLIEIRDSAIVLGQCHQYGNFIGAMVDIQVYTCIPKDFRLE